MGRMTMNEVKHYVNCIIRMTTLMCIGITYRCSRYLYRLHIPTQAPFQSDVSLYVVYYSSVHHDSLTSYSPLLFLFFVVIPSKSSS